jgi:hypothetical protein
VLLRNDEAAEAGATDDGKAKSKKNGKSKAVKRGGFSE